MCRKSSKQGVIDVFKDVSKTKDIVINCYRKFKSHVYYSNNLQYLKEKIAEFEADESKMEESFLLITEMLVNRSFDRWEEWLKGIKCKVFPKVSTVVKNNTEQVVSNYSSFEDIIIDKVNFFINAPIEVFIVDTLWTVLIGEIIVDKKIFHDEVQANIYNDKIYSKNHSDLLASIDFNNLSIYNPYFKGYKNWKNGAIYRMEDNYDRGLNSTLLSLDLTSYFYSIDVDFEQIKKDLTSEDDNRYYQFDFISGLIEQLYSWYSKVLHKFREDVSVSQKVIPIGLVSSGVVSNLYLHSLDLKLKRKTGVIYYSRYVDDIVIVINNAERSDDLRTIITQYFSDCFEYSDEKISIIGFPKLVIQSSKIKVLKLFASQSKRHIAILKQEITNTSEPNLLPSVDIDLENFINKAYSHPEESIKIRDIGDLNVNTLGLMRFISSYLRSKKNTKSSNVKYKKRRNLSYYDRIDTETQEQLSLFFKDSTLFSLYAKWDRIFYFAILYHSDFELANKIYNDILNNIEKIDFKYDFVRKSMQKTVSRELKRSLREQLYVCFSMALAVRYNVKLFSKYFGNKTYLLRRATLIQKSNMFDNNLVEFPMLNYYKNNNKGKTSYSGITFEECINRYYDADLDEFSIKYAPRFIHFQEYCISQNILKIDCVSDESFLDDILLGYRAILKRFSSYSNELSLRVNTLTKTKNNNYIVSNIEARSPEGYAKDSPSQVYIALANMNLKKHRMFEHGRFNFAQCTFERKSELYKLLNDAYEFTIRKQKYNSKRLFGLRNMLGTQESGLKFLAFPEVAIPIEWLEEIAQFVRITGTAVVCGIKHFVKGDRIYNCVATVIPVGNNIGLYHNALVVLREKNDYSPDEISMIEHNKYKIPETENSYNCIFNWDGIRFSVFDCYELTDIYARAIMKSKLDVLFAPEYNKDINYFSNIVDSASRDIYCFVAQINTSNYGDTKIVAPYKSELKCLLDIKGGEQDSIHIGSINLAEYREYQRFEGTQEFKNWKDYERKKEKRESKQKYSEFKKYKRTSARHKK